MDVICTKCGTKQPYDPMVWRCGCGGPLDLDYSGSFDRDLLAGKPMSLWRYCDALPLEESAGAISLGEPVTPLVPFKTGDKEILLKLECLLPTGSYKDRGTTVMMSDLASRGISRIVEDSSGNAGASVAAYAARAGIDAEIYVPAATSKGKTVQISAYGATLVKVEGDRQATAQAIRSAAEKICYASHVWNPMFMQGTKTAAYEIAEQLGWRLPSQVILTVGHGALLLGVYRGFKELLEMGFAKSIPRIIAVQPEGCAPLAAAWNGREFCQSSGTIAEGAAVTKPIRKKQIFAAVRETGGEVVTVSDGEIGHAIRTLAATGLFAEPTAGVGLAWALQNNIQDDTIAFVTGHGLKSPDALLSLLS